MQPTGHYLASAAGAAVAPSVLRGAGRADEVTHRPVDGRRSRILLILPRGEAVRNFLYSGVAEYLAQNADLTLLTVVEDQSLLAPHIVGVNDVRVLRHYEERRSLRIARGFLDEIHYRTIWTEVGKMMWERLVEDETKPARRLRRRLQRALIRPLANRPTLALLTRCHQRASWMLRPTDEFRELMTELKPDLVVNGSHIHGPAAEEPLRAARFLGIPTAAFVFSWDNITSRGRIVTPYDHYFVWNEIMKNELLGVYSEVQPEQVSISGTPQLDFHFQSKYRISREELCKRIGADPARPIVLYTTGMDTHFPEEHRTVQAVIGMLQKLDPMPQLVVRTYIKGTSREMQAIADARIPGVIFPQVLWEPRWLTPLHEDLYIYPNLLRECALGINVASTVSLELLLNDKPVVNLGFDPPGSRLERWKHYARHLVLDHYRPVSESGAVMIATNEHELNDYIIRGLTRPEEGAPLRRAFIRNFFGDTLDGGSAVRLAEGILALGRKRQARGTAASKEAA